MSEYVPDISEELMAGFFDEAPEYLEMLDGGLMAFEDKVNAGGFSMDDPEDQARMNEMFRAAHSLKGLGAAMGFDKIRDLTHLMETLFDQVRMGKRSLDQVAFETLFGVFDKLKELIKELADPPDEPVSIDEMLAKLEAVLHSSTESDVAENAGEHRLPAGANGEVEGADMSCAAADGAGPSHTEPRPAAKGNDEGTLPAKDSGKSGKGVTTNPTAVESNSEILENPELAQLFVETTLETLDELNEALLKLENKPEDADLINSVFRCAHNIKGATGAAGCMAIYHFTHDMETALDLVRNNQIKLDSKLMQAVFCAVDRIRSDIELIKEGHADRLTGEGTVGIFDAWLAEKTSSLGSNPLEGVDRATPPSPSPMSNILGASASRRSDSSGDAEESKNAEQFATPETLECDDEEKEVKVTFPKDFAEAEIQAYLIHNKLREVGDILETNPDVDAMDGSTAVEEITYRIQTTASADELKQLVETYSVQSVTVSGGGQQADAAPKPSSSESKTETTPDANRANSMIEKKATTPTAAASKPGPSRSIPAAAVKSKPPVKVGETIRVDLERLDQLMNLGGELVINKARLTQIHGRFDPLFHGQDMGYLVDDMSDRMTRLSTVAGQLSSTADGGQKVSELSDTILHLSHDFQAIKAMVARIHEGRGAMNDFSEALHALNRVSEGMQKRIMETRMVSVGPLFQRFRRVVRDIARSNGKKVELILRGESTELDKRMIDELGDPLTHMIRNSVDHGLEGPEDRVKAGKPETGEVILEAYHRGRHICIEVRDDGRGVNVEAVKRKIIERELATEAEVERMPEKEIIQYVFKPGFSTAEKVTDLSGRGMGMDIVINKLEGINGTVDIESVTGQGATVTIKLPLTLAIITSILARIGQSVYAVPLETVAEIITVKQSSIQFIQKKRVVRVRERVIPVAFFEQIFNVDADDLQTATCNDPSLTLVILNSQDETIGLVVDELIGQEDVVIKSISENYRNVTGITGASIMGDGRVSLILDVASMINMFATRLDTKGAISNCPANGLPEKAPSAAKELIHAGAN